MAKSETQAPADQKAPPTVASVTPPVQNGVTVVERRIDPQREALREAATKDHQRRLEPGQWVNLPNGEAVQVHGFIGMKYPGDQATAMLGRPQDILLDPKPRFASGERYQWRVRTSADPRDGRPAETANLHRSERIRYVETSEVDPHSESAVYTEYGTANNTYVTWQSLILCEVLDERLAYQKQKGWEDLAISRTMNLESEVLAHPDTHLGTKTTTKVDIGDTRRGS